MRKLLSVFFALFVTSFMFAQTSVTGTVTELKSGMPIPGANVKVKGKSIGTTTDFDGNFSLRINESIPFILEVSLLGYKPQEIQITSDGQVVNVKLEELATALDEVVVSASRTPERVLESPVTIERMDYRAIKNSAAADFYDGLENLKGVDINTNSFTFKSVNTRGFATFANTRFMQLVDGMDNSSPALNFNLGNLLGMSELDVNTVELLPGASSALYGANAFNGILFMTSKNPFDTPGVDFYGKTGLTSQKAAGDNNFYDVGVRVAHKFSDKFAAKASVSFLKGTEWYATDYRDFSDVSRDRSHPNYDGLNIYGDEVSVTLDFDALAGLPSGVLGTHTVSRTGYEERDLMDYGAESFKTDIALHYRPTGEGLEIIYNGKFGNGNTIYQGSNRYAIDGFFMQQHKIEARDDNFFVRLYMTDEDAGNSYDTRFAAININREWKGDLAWFGDYIGGYAAAKLGAGASEQDAHNAGRAAADVGRFLPGSAEFNAALDKVSNDGDLLTGAKFTDNSRIYHGDVNYNFFKEIDFADIQVGGSWRQYSLNSQGTIFTDYDGAINYDEFGAYMQIQDKWIDDRLKFTGSLRYDKAQNFDGNFSPRVSVSYSLGKGKTRNLRASFQTGFRNPTTQDQYIGLNAGAAYLVGSAPDNLDRYTTNPIDVSTAGQALGVPAQVTLVGRAAYENSFTLNSVLTGAPQKANFQYVQPEKVTAWEIGYRAGFGRLSLDASAYYNQYEDFIGNKNVIVPLYGQADFSDGGLAGAALQNDDFEIFQIYTNSTADISSWGGTIGINTKIFGDFDLGVNYTLAKFEFDQASDPDYEAGFNTPEHKVKVSFGHTQVLENFGFKLDYRWSDEYLWQASFADGIISARSVVDAQVNYTVPSLKSIIKLGGANIGGVEYFSAPGVGKIGSQYYLSWTVNL